MKCAIIINFRIILGGFHLVEKAILAKALCSGTSSYSLDMCCQGNRVSEAANTEIHKDILAD